MHSVVAKNEPFIKQTLFNLTDLIDLNFRNPPLVTAYPVSWHHLKSHTYMKSLLLSLPQDPTM